jgi:tetratricopeptide (TPR) repeat protein
MAGAPSTPAPAHWNTDAEPMLSKGAALGRYVVLDPLGRGGMGIVYAAYDPVLDRRVAVKLLRRVARDSGEQDRLLREGMTMARLSHPNIVTVHDVGTFEQRIFVAMELVEGQTLRRWSEQPRSWRETVAMYVQAGRGLAAAHAAGIVHRDFKPDNVIVGHDGRPRVVDFGMAQGLGEVRAGTSSGSEPQARAAPEREPEVAGSTSDGDAGSIFGTPRYMSVEQLRGEGVDARADQFAFCVSLWEALYGEPPFQGRDLVDLLFSVREQPPRAPTGREVPAHLRAALEKGLAATREERFPSMDALLAALERDPLATRRRSATLLGAAVVGAIALLAVERTHAGASADPCAHPDRDLSGGWDGAVKARVQAAFSETHRPYAGDTATRVEAMLDEYAAAYTKMRGEVCVASRDGKGSASLRALRDACLDHRRGQLEALASVFAEKPDPGVLDKAVSAAAALPPIADCADVDALASRVPPPEDPAQRARIAGLRRDADRIDALLQAGRYKEGAALAGGALATASDLHYAPLSAQLQLLAGQLRARTGEYDEAKRLLRDAAASGAAANDHVVVAKAWANILYVVGERERHAEEAKGLILFGPTLLGLAHEDRVEVTWRTYEGLALWRMGRFAESKAAHEQALGIATRALRPDDPQRAVVLNNLALALTDLGDTDGALEAVGEALAIRQQVLGPDHPQVGTAYNNLGNVDMDRGDLPQAKEAYENAERIWVAALGPTHPDVCTVRNNIANAYKEMGDWARAREIDEQVLATREQILGPEHPDFAQSLYNLGTVLLAAGDAGHAASLEERSLAILEKALGHDRSELGYPLHALGRARVRLHQLAEARAVLDRALVLVDIPEEQKRLLPATLLGEGELATAQGHPVDAIPLLERALSLATADTRAEIALALADALWSGHDADRARMMADQARASFASLGHAPGVAQATRWLDAHP